jgi:Helix-turn-helix domain
MSSGYRSLMWYLLFGTRGGPNRRRILDALTLSPANAHQLAATLHLDYRTVRHHLRLLERHGAVVRPVGDAYASPYELAPSTLAYLEVLPGATPAPAVPARVRARSAAPRPFGGGP